MTHFGVPEVIDLTNETDSEEDAPVVRRLLKKIKKLDLPPSTYKSRVVESPSSVELPSRSKSSKVKTSETGNEKTLSSIKKRTSEASRTEATSTKTKKHKTAHEHWDLITKKIARNPTGSKASKTKDKVRNIGSGKAPVAPPRSLLVRPEDQVESSYQSQPQPSTTNGKIPKEADSAAHRTQNRNRDTQLSKTSDAQVLTDLPPVQPPVPNTVHNGLTKAVRDVEPAVQRVDKFVQKTTVLRKESTGLPAKDHIISEIDAHLTNTDKQSPFTGKVKKSSNHSTPRTIAKDSLPVSNQTFEKDCALSFNRFIDAANHDNHTGFPSGYSSETPLVKRILDHVRFQTLNSNPIIQNHEAHKLREVSNQERIAAMHGVPFVSKKIEQEKTRLTTYPLYSRGSLLRNRVLGGPGHLDMQQSFMRIRDSCLDTMFQPWKEWTGASKDVIRAAWAPDGLSFVIGSSTDLDTHSIQYNRSNNLLWCNMATSALVELDNHKVKKLQYDVNINSEAVDPNGILNPYIFTTISDICYGRSSTLFWTSSYDGKIKMWNVEDESPRCVGTHKHEKQVDIMTMSNGIRNELLASAQNSTRNAVHVYRLRADKITDVPDSTQAEKYNLVPTALAWGNPVAKTGTLLATGWGEKDSDSSRHPRGDVVVWDAETSTQLTDLTSRYQYVYDLAWHTTQPWLAAAIPPKEKTYAGLQGTQSHIRIWEPLSTHQRYIYDLDCLALDTNKIIFNPRDPFCVSAACTDGIIYHYDIRQPEQILAKFEHDAPISQLDLERSRESQDFGIQFISWNAAGTLLYSGSSDGKIKQWNPYLNNEDAFIEDIAVLDAGISSGCFSPDFTNLLVGTNKGSAHVFSSAPVTPWVDHVEEIYSDGEEENKRSVYNSRFNRAPSFKYRAATGNSTA